MNLNQNCLKEIAHNIGTFCSFQASCVAFFFSPCFVPNSFATVVVEANSPFACRINRNRGKLGRVNNRKWFGRVTRITWLPSLQTWRRQPTIRTCLQVPRLRKQDYFSRTDGVGFLEPTLPAIFLNWARHNGCEGMNPLPLRVVRNVSARKLSRILYQMSWCVRRLPGNIRTRYIRVRVLQAIKARSLRVFNFSTVSCGEYYAYHMSSCENWSISLQAVSGLFLLWSTRRIYFRAGTNLENFSLLHWQPRN